LISKVSVPPTACLNGFWHAYKPGRRDYTWFVRRTVSMPDLDQHPYPLDASLLGLALRMVYVLPIIPTQHNSKMVLRRIEIGFLYDKPCS
jgi:hypothetical protein